MHPQAGMPVDDIDVRLCVSNVVYCCSNVRFYLYMVSLSQVHTSSKSRIMILVETTTI